MSNKAEFNELTKQFKNRYDTVQTAKKAHTDEKCSAFMRIFPQMLVMAVENYGNDKYSIYDKEIVIDTPGCYASLTLHLKELGLRQKRHSLDYKDDNLLGMGKVYIDMFNQEFRFF